MRASKRQICAPVPGCSAMTSLKGVQKTSWPSTKSGVAWNFDSIIVFCERFARSPVRPTERRSAGARDEDRKNNEATKLRADRLQKPLRGPLKQHDRN